MKSLREYILEDGEAGGIAPSLGAMMDAGKVEFASPSNTMGMGNPKLPTEKDPGSEPLGCTKKMNKKKKKEVE